MSATWTWDFFIAHAGRDKASAESLFDLMAAGSRAFLDSRCLELGDDWDAKLAAAQGASFITVVLVSSNTEQAYYQREEIAAAIAMAREAEQKHRVVPLYLDAEATAVPYGLRLKHGLRLAGDFALADAARDLLALLGRLRKSLPAPAPEDPAHPSTEGVSSEPGILLQPPKTWTSPVRRNHWRYKVAAFDFDGTLLRGKDFDFSWEAVWRGLSFGKKIQTELRNAYRLRSGADLSRAVRVKAYQDWCEGACAQFKTRGLTRDQLRGLAKPLTLTRNCRPALAELRAQNVVVAIISGGINTFLEDLFPDYREYVDFVFINELIFTAAGDLDGVRATPFDFEGKAEALEIVCNRVGCTTAEAVFVGDQYNDEAVMLKADKVIAYPPKGQAVSGAAHEVIAKDDLKKVIPHILVE